jgi:2-polyprenyl-6-methoxyphenol hydroxylase-like FAD-dependent oxidoreductase
MGGDRYGPHLRVLVVGGGIAGLSLAGLLRRRGFRPRLVEVGDQSWYERRDHVLGLWPSGTDILKGLGLYDRLADVGQALREYVVADERGATVRRYDLGLDAERFGSGHLVSRSQFLDLLRAGLGDTPVHRGTTVRRLAQRPDAVEVTLSDGTTDSYDLVVGADGLDSATRGLAFGPVPLRPAGLRAWAFRVDAPPGAAAIAPGTVVEQWGRGRFCGLYAAKGTVGGFLAVAHPASGTSTAPALDDTAALRACFSAFHEPAAGLVAALPAPGAIWRADLVDLSRTVWWRGRVVLLGDAAHAPLPAGAGASLAMESAAVLADELTRTDSRHLPRALERYVARRRRRVQTFRVLARLMWASLATTSPLAMVARNATMRRLPDGAFRWYLAALLSRPV